ncbi:transposase [Nocardia sp. NPDC051911]|uniref:transposase n=1 Tax=Nocardia sp. NPDC051911 TaxID=3154648 RepID=UPI00341EFE19
MLARVGGVVRAGGAAGWARAYVAGLLALAEWKNSRQLAEVGGGGECPDGCRHLLNRAREVRDQVRAYVVEALASPDGVLVVDETGFVKKGLCSVGVQRQCSGTAGSIQISQPTVSATRVSCTTPTTGTTGLATN